MAGYLFGDGWLHDFLAQKRRELNAEINGMQRDYLLNASEHDLCRYLIDKYTLEPPKINLEGKEIVEERPIIVQRTSQWGDGQRFEVPGQQIVIAVPFEGDPALLRYVPSTFVNRRVEADIVGNEIRLQYQVDESASQQLEQRINSDLSLTHQNSMNVERDVQNHNRDVPKNVKADLLARKDALKKQMNFVESLKMPIRRRESAGQTYAVPTVKRKPRIERPAVPSGTFKPEPTLDIEEYEYILGIAQNMAVMLERNPSTFAKLGEEEIRNHFLVQFNGHYEGQATGETFNQYGKTDIIIKDGGRNVFIAECKFWCGPKAFGDIIDQLLGYTSWRDTKIAIFLFNKNKDTTKVLDQIPALVKGHPNYKRENPGRLDETRFRYVLHQAGDKNREVLLTVCVFDVPS